MLVLVEARSCTSTALRRPGVPGAGRLAGPVWDALPSVSSHNTAGYVRVASQHGAAGRVRYLREIVRSVRAELW